MISNLFKQFVEMLQLLTQDLEGAVRKRKACIVPTALLHLLSSHIALSCWEAAAHRGPPWRPPWRRDPCGSLSCRPRRSSPRDSHQSSPRRWSVRNLRQSHSRTFTKALR